METTFISIHDLSPDAIILYTSDSVIDILGYTPDEIVNRPVWDLFPPEELPFARKFHQQRVSTDKAAVLAYCRVKHSDGSWVGCECCFTIVYDVMVVCTSIYKRGLNAEKRAVEAPQVRRIFSSSPKDPRYHMLTHLSAKFTQPAAAQLHEPRAALFLNRFTRTLTVMYATSGVQDVIGISAEDLRGKSFYYCIAENCLKDAIKCLENAKGNDSIAYLRFWFRDPRNDSNLNPDNADDSDEEMTTDLSEDQSDGGVHLHHASYTSPQTSEMSDSASMDIDSDEQKTTSRGSSGHSTHPSETHDAIFGQPRAADSSASSLDRSPDRDRRSPAMPQADEIELEAVISCTSDGLVVCLRKARPMIPHPTQRPSRPVYKNGLFAAPWAVEPVLPPVTTRAGAGFGPAFAPALGPQGARLPATVHAGGLDQQGFMNAIREQAIFCWALTGINGSLAEHGRGKPRGEALPQDGLPVWASDSHAQTQPANNGLTNETLSCDGADVINFSSSSFQDGRRSASHIFGDPGLTSRANGSVSTSVSNSSGGTPFPS